MEERREELRLSQEALAAASDTSLSTVGRLERGQYVSPRMMRRIEAALGWQKGSLDAVRDGGEPTFLQPEPDTAGPDLRDSTERYYWETGKKLGIPEEDIWLPIEIRRARNARRNEVDPGQTG